MFAATSSSSRSLGSLLPAARAVPLSLARQSVFTAGDVSLLLRPCVAVIGSRDATPAGLRLADELARLLVASGVVVVSGLAAGVDAAAHRAARSAGGSTVAVLGTGLERVYPPHHVQLQRQLSEDHLVVTQFPGGSPVRRSHFPRRNCTMAALSDATVVVQAGSSSGTRHQVAACRSGPLTRPVLLHRSLLEARVPWALSYVSDPGVRVFETAGEALQLLQGGGLR